VIIIASFASIGHPNHAPETSPFGSSALALRAQRPLNPDRRRDSNQKLKPQARRKSNPVYCTPFGFSHLRFPSLSPLLDLSPPPKPSPQSSILSQGVFEIFYFLLLDNVRLSLFAGLPFVFLISLFYSIRFFLPSSLSPIRPAFSPQFRSSHLTNSQSASPFLLIPQLCQLFPLRSFLSLAFSSTSCFFTFQVSRERRPTILGLKRK